MISKFISFRFIIRGTDREVRPTFFLSRILNTDFGLSRIYAEMDDFFVLLPVATTY